MKKMLLLFVLGAWATVAGAQSFQIDVSGNVVFDYTMFTITEAGEDFAPNLESTATTYIGVFPLTLWDLIFNGNSWWEIEVSKVDVNWSDDLTLEVKRDGNGTVWLGNGNGKVLFGGTSYMEVGNTPTYFFRGRRFVYDIPIAFRLSGLSLAMGSRDLECDVIFTVYDR